MVKLNSSPAEYVDVIKVQWFILHKKLQETSGSGCNSRVQLHEPWEKQTNKQVNFTYFQSTKCEIWVNQNSLSLEMRLQNILKDSGSLPQSRSWEHVIWNFLMDSGDSSPYLTPMQPAFPQLFINTQTIQSFTYLLSYTKF